MSEVVIGFLLLVGAPFLIGIGVFVGWLIFGKRSTPPTWHSDAVATSRTIQQLADDGIIDEELRSKLFTLLRQAYDQQVKSTPVRTAVARQSDAEDHVTVKAENEAPSAHADAAAVPAARDIEEVPVEAEVVEEVAPPRFVHPLDAPEPSRPPAAHTTATASTGVRRRSASVYAR